MSHRGGVSLKIKNRVYSFTKKCKKWYINKSLIINKLSTKQNKLNLRLNK
jgi:hypothetical protein